MKFRLPRKIKKKLNGLFLYPSDEDGSSVMAFPKRNQKDYDAYKQGILEQPFNYTKAELKEKSEKWDVKFRTPCELSDEELVKAVESIFGKEYWDEAINTFRQAKNHPVANEDYVIFCNAYNHTVNGDDCSITACMSLESALDDLKRSKPRKL